MGTLEVGLTEFLDYVIVTYIWGPRSGKQQIQCNCQDCQLESFFQVPEIIPCTRSLPHLKMHFLFGIIYFSTLPFHDTWLIIYAPILTCPHSTNEITSITPSQGDTSASPLEYSFLPSLSGTMGYGMVILYFKVNIPL